MKKNIENINKNEIAIPAGMTIDGKKILGIIGGKIIGEEGSFFKVALEDGTQATIPAEQFNQK